MFIRRPSDIGLLVKAARKARSMSQDDLARRLGVSRCKGASCQAGGAVLACSRNGLPKSRRTWGTALRLVRSPTASSAPLSGYLPLQMCFSILKRLARPLYFPLRRRNGASFRAALARMLQPVVAVRVGAAAYNANLIIKATV